LWRAAGQRKIQLVGASILSVRPLDCCDFKKRGAFEKAKR
jgi:hypothetical protein